MQPSSIKTFGCCNRHFGKVTTLVWLTSLTIFYRVLCVYTYSAHLNFTVIFGKKIFLFLKNNFTRINDCQFFHHKSHLKPFLRYHPCRNAQGIFQHHFQCIKVRTILDKYSYYKTIGWPPMKTIFSGTHTEKTQP